MHACSVFSISVATVIGLTPPGTGVMYDARAGFVKHDVANDLAIFQTVNTDINHNCAFFNPFAGNKARFTYGDNEQISMPDMVTQIFVKRCVTVVVQPASNSSMLIGRPTILDAPMTTAFRP